MKKRVLLGMSGGVDSSVSAILLKEKGYEIIGATMKLWTGNNKIDKEKNEKTIIDAKRVCDKLNIKYYILDAQKEFEESVINNFILQYQNAETPNPCIECNKYIKFGYFYQKAKELKCDYIATGHYARIEYSDKYKQFVLKKSKEEKKDQSYFLYTISKEKLKSIIFPLQDYTTKEEIRKIAKENGLEIADKKDSQEICFIPDNCYQNFLNGKIENGDKEGKIILKTGEVLGKHKGLVNYTIGQRKGISISYKEPLYVIELRSDTNELVVGPEKELYSKRLTASNINWQIDFDEKEINCLAKIRYRAKEEKAKVIKEEDKVIVEFETPQRAITKGQSVVFYDEEGIVLGGRKNFIKKLVYFKYL